MELPCLEKFLSRVDSAEKLKAFLYFFIRTYREMGVCDREMESLLEKTKLSCAGCSGLTYFKEYKHLSMSEIYLAVRPDEEPEVLSCREYLPSIGEEDITIPVIGNSVCLVCPLEAPDLEKRVQAEYRVLATLLSSPELFSALREVKTSTFSTVENLKTCCNGIWPESFTYQLTTTIYEALLETEDSFYDRYRLSGVSAITDLVYDSILSVFMGVFGEIPEFNRGAFEEYLAARLQTEVLTEEELRGYCRKKTAGAKKGAKKRRGKETFAFAGVIEFPDAIPSSAAAETGPGKEPSSGLPDDMEIFFPDMESVPVKEKEEDACSDKPEGESASPGSLPEEDDRAGNGQDFPEERTDDAQVPAGEESWADTETYACPLALDVPITKGLLLGPDDILKRTPPEDRRYRIPFLEDESGMLHPVLDKDVLFSLPCLDREKELLLQMLSGADRYREISLEAAYVESVGYVLLFFGTMDSYAGYIRVMSASGRMLDLDESVKKMLAGKRVCKICYMPYLVTGILAGQGIRAEKIYSIYSTHMVIRRGSSPGQSGAFHDSYDKVIGGYAGGILREKDRDFLNKVRERYSEEESFLFHMASYSLIRRRQESLAKTLGLQKKLLRQQGLDLMLGYSFLRENLFPESGVSFTLGDTKPVWREFHLTPCYEPGYVLEFSFDAPTDRARARALRRGLLVYLSKLPTAFTKGLLGILYMNETCLMVYVHHTMRRHYDSHIAHFMTTRAYQLGIYEFTLNIRKWGVTDSLVRFVAKAALEDKNDNIAEKAEPSEKQNGASAGKQKEKTGEETN